VGPRPYQRAAAGRTAGAEVARHRPRARIAARCGQPCPHARPGARARRAEILALPTSGRAIRCRRRRAAPAPGEQPIDRLRFLEARRQAAIGHDHVEALAPAARARQGAADAVSQRAPLGSLASPWPRRASENRLRDARPLDCGDHLEVYSHVTPAMHREAARVMDQLLT